jgi:hypothetical protein
MFHFITTPTTYKPIEGGKSKKSIKNKKIIKQIKKELLKKIKHIKNKTIFV